MDILTHDAQISLLAPKDYANEIIIDTSNQFNGAVSAATLCTYEKIVLRSNDQLEVIHKDAGYSLATGST